MYIKKRCKANERGDCGKEGAEGKGVRTRDGEDGSRMVERKSE